MIRIFYLLAGWLSLALAALGVALPLLPTVPFVILAAFFFARGSPRLEAWLVNHPTMGPHIQAWRTRGAVSRKGKIAALIGFSVSAGMGLLLLRAPYSLIPLSVALIGGGWLMRRPE